MGTRLFEDFQKKNISHKVGKARNLATNDEIVIAIPLKNSTGTKT